MAQRVESSVVVNAPVNQVYSYWRNLENLPNFMTNIEDVRSTGPGMTHWVVKGPLGVKMEFDAQTTQEEENRELAWNSLEGSVQTSGEVRFQELGSERTRIEVTMNYEDLPGGRIGETEMRASRCERPHLTRPRRRANTRRGRHRRQHGEPG